MGADKKTAVSDLMEQGKLKGKLTTKEITDALEELDFDVEQMEHIGAENLANTFREFRPYLDECRFVGCTHTKEKGCAVLAALKDGKIAASRHASYIRLYQQAKEIKPWQQR